jgi:hypothetical protein
VTIGWGAVLQGPLPAILRTYRGGRQGRRRRPRRGGAGARGGLAAFERGPWRDADRRFATVHASNPSDGPARFYHSYCEQDLTGAPTPVSGAIKPEHG